MHSLLPGTLQCELAMLCHNLYFTEKGGPVFSEVSWQNSNLIVLDQINPSNNKIPSTAFSASAPLWDTVGGFFILLGHLFQMT